jgi:hypothetical protein
MALGRPTTFSPEVVERAKQYLLSCSDTYDADTETWNVELPSIEGLALALGIWRSTVYEWKEKHQDFADILEEILSAQAKRLIERSLGGKYNANIAKLALGKHGYHDTSAVDHTSKGEKIESVMSPAILAATKKYEEELKKAITE